MRKLLVANRSEIAIRVFRAATELGLSTVAVFTHEDRFSLHRFKADEAYLIGPPEGGMPVKGYLDIPAIIAVAKEHQVDAIHPGYGFLSENAELSRQCKEAGIVFVGPTAELLETFGDKTAAKRVARKAKVPTVPGTDGALSDPAKVKAAAAEVGYPVILKASFGGGGRGMRVVLNESEILGKLEEASREAGAAFGRGEVFIERYVRKAKHIEVQILGDTHGNIVHLWERDCSVQRRHQKVVEIAPSIDLPQQLRVDICEAAKRLCATAGYINAGTVEFLVDVERNEFFFIEVNPRIQVEHTVTEVVTGIDLVKSQIRVAQGHKLHEAPLSIPPQEKIETRGYAVQCRITTEDPENSFIPDYGRISTYRSPGGFAVRLDGGNGFGGSVITPYFDSLLVKVITSGTTFLESIDRMDRALREFRIRGVKTNIPFLENLINHPAFRNGEATTTFIDQNPSLFQFKAKRDRATKLLTYLGDVIVNGRPEVKGKVDVKRRLPMPVVPPYPHGQRPPLGTKDKLTELGPVKFAEWVRKQKRLMLTDTTMRDAHQSLLATRVRTYDLLKVAESTAHLMPNLFSLEMWGGATFDTTMRFLQEDPWDRLYELRKRVPNILFQMLLRASNAVGYTNYPDNVVKSFTKTAAEAGIDVFRIFDSLNWVDNMQVAIETVREHTNSLCEASICYTGDILDPRRTKYSLLYYISMAKKLVAMGTNILAIKDMAGLAKPFAAKTLVKALRDEVGVPIHFHTHDTSGVQAASYLMASDAGVDVVDVALASMSGMTSQPNLNSIVAAMNNTARDTQVDLDAANRLSDYWEATRQAYYPFEEGMLAGTAEVYHHEMPGGQYTNLRQQAKSMGLEARWREIADAYAQVNQLFGDIVKVTPSSKVVGDMAIFMVTNNLTATDILTPGRQHNFPKSVVEMMQGMLGFPEGGWPKVLQKIILDSASEKPIKGRPGSKLEKVDLAATKKELQKKIGREPRDVDVQSYLMYPKVYLDFDKTVKLYDNVSVIPTPAFFYGLQPGEEITLDIEAGKTLIIRYLTVGEPREDGTRTVFFELNGQPREVNVPDRSLEATLHKHPKANPDDAKQIAAPMPGKVTNIAVKPGDLVKGNERLLSIEAMKMETAVYAPREGKIKEVAVKPGSAVTAGDLLVVLEA
ncbi:pyruvate carboxylase [Humisphaera borealis]|uniref:Pyruvate carboxylase n=1 Tax=Humisphaera borealis TaxID=2807512 RepID=A0A7M2WQA7_9BACT|nr:pyruvate carboxylase [Humisphaera borealis]QOV87583.1 pyruvate carboxylase [Humisphaera borealis]